MKLQHLTVIFAIIMIPIVLALSFYVQNNVDTISKQTGYDASLYNATYDAMKAFQLNTTNNYYSSISDSKIRDIEASANTFFNALGTNLRYGEYNKNTIETYVPGLLFTLYDGYYIYSPYKNTYNGVIDNGLKPYIYYSERYVQGDSYDFVINYTLDNLIVVYGKVDGEYVTKAGYLINLADIGGVNYNTITKEAQYINGQPLTYKGYTITEENLQETLVTKEGENFVRGTYPYININGYKIYYDKNGHSLSNGAIVNFFRVSANERNWLTDNFFTTNFTGEEINQIKSLKDTNSKEYYRSAYEFTSWVNDNLSSITSAHVKPINGDTAGYENTGNSKLFMINNNNDPAKRESAFNEHRRSVIRKSIETNLNIAISNYNDNSQAMGTTYNFKLPVLAEEEWDKIIDNICIVSFMQGLPVNNKYYNNYCIIANNKNKELVLQDSLFFVDTKGIYHKLGCQTLHAQIQSDADKITGYLNTMFIRQSVKNEKIKAEGEDIAYYYPADSRACYDCVVADSNTKNMENVLDETKREEGDLKNYTIQRQAYWTAFGREKYNSYKMNTYLNMYEIGN